MSGHPESSTSPTTPDSGASTRATAGPTTPANSAATTVLTPTTLRRLLLGWGGVIALSVLGPLLPDPLPGPALTGLLVAVIWVIILCARGAATQAEHLAHRLGDPYGTLVLTLSVVMIEVALISAVMLSSPTSDAHATIARDSVMAATMIVLNLVTGVALVLGDLRHRRLRVNRTGFSAYLCLLVVLIATAFAVPAFLSPTGAYTTAQAWTVIVATVLLYGVFLLRQTGAQRADFQEIVQEVMQEITDAETTPSPSPAYSAPAPTPRKPQVHATSRPAAEITHRTLLLLATVVPVVLLSHKMAVFLDDAVARLGAPVAVPGILVAAIVFLPEALTTVRAAAHGEGQRMSNLAHGALVSCVGLTVPVVLAIGLFTGHPVILAESPVNLVLLGTSLLLTAATFSSPQPTAAHGVAHLFLFTIYVLSIVS